MWVDATKHNFWVIHKSPVHIDWKICLVEGQFLRQVIANINKMIVELVTNILSIGVKSIIKV